MNEAIKAGEVFRLAEIVPYQDGKIVNMDVVHNDKMKFVIMAFDAGTELSEHAAPGEAVPFPVSWTVKMKKKQKETQDILSYHTQAAGCSDKARAKASGGRQPIEECGRTGL